MTATEDFAERQRDIARTYDRVSAQVTWLLGERGVDDAAVAKAILSVIRGEPVGLAALTATNRRNVVGRLSLLCLWRGPFLAKTFLASGPIRLERVAAGEGTIGGLLGELRTMEGAPREDDALLTRLRALLGEPDDLVENLWSLEDPSLQATVDAVRARLASDEGRAIVDLVASEVARQVAEVAADAGELTSAAAYVARARRHVGGAHLDVARTSFSSEALARALAAAGAALALEPENVEALLLRAQLSVMAGQDLARAKDDAARVVARDPGDGQAHAVLAQALQAEGDLSAALEAFTRAIEAERRYVPAFVYRGVLRVDGGDLDGAEQDAAAAIAELPRAPGGYWIRGRACAQRGDRSAAFEAFETALALDPNHAATYAARADVHTAGGDDRRALADLDRAVALSGAGTTYFNRGNVKLAMRDLDGAEADFTKAIERDAKDAQAYMNRGTVRLMRGRADAGLEDLRRAAEAAPDYAQARMKYGVVLFELGRRPEALVELRAALACAPTGWAPRAQIEGIVASIS